MGNLLKEMVSEEQNLKTALLAKIEKFQTEILELTTKLHLPNPKPEEGLSLMQREKEMR